MSQLVKLPVSFFAKAHRGRKKAFLDGAMAASALVATAEREVSLAKRHRVDEVLANVPALRTFDVHVASDLFRDFVDRIHDDPDRGRGGALEAVGALAGEGEEAHLLVRIACAVAQADGGYSPAGIAAVHEIAEALGQSRPDLGEELAAAGSSGPPRIVAVGNQKGGTGKSTLAFHLAIGLLRRGRRVGCVDLDAQQATLTHYLANRSAYAERSEESIPLPAYVGIEPVQVRDRAVAEEQETERLKAALTSLGGCDTVILDTPGSDNHLARLGHANADVLVTPLNDSFLDIDVLARVDRERRLVLGPSVYARMVAQQSEHRVAGGRAPIDWIVLRNRLAQLDAHNTRDMARLLAQLAGRMGFRLLPGLSERMVYRELFYSGLTLLDLPQDPNRGRVKASHRNARRELDELLDAVASAPKTPNALGGNLLRIEA